MNKRNRVVAPVKGAIPAPLVYTPGPSAHGVHPLPTLTQKDMRKDRALVEALAAKIAASPLVVAILTAVCRAFDIELPPVVQTPRKLTPVHVAAVLYDAAMFSHLDLLQVHAFAERLLLAKPSEFQQVADVMVEDVREQIEVLLFNLDAADLDDEDDDEPEEFDEDGEPVWEVAS